MFGHGSGALPPGAALWQTVSLACRAFLRATARRHYASPPIKAGPDPAMTFIEGETVAAIFPCALLEPGSSQFAPVILFITNYQIYLKSVYQPRPSDLGWFSLFLSLSLSKALCFETQEWDNAGRTLPPPPRELSSWGNCPKPPVPASLFSLEPVSPLRSC